MHDILLSLDGDIVPNWQGGLSEGDNWDIDTQDINWRILTNDPEQAAYSIGANLEDLLGLPNSPATASVGENSITSALTSDGRFDLSTVNVVGAPISASELQFFIGVQKTDSVRTSTPYTTTVVSLTG